MYYLFLLLAILALIGFFVFLFRKIRPLWKKLLGLLGSLIMVFVALFFFVFPPFGQIDSGVADEVESQIIYLKHETAYKEYETEKGQREIPVRVWCPKNNSKKNLPVLIFSHGSFGIDQSNEILFQQLAAKGYLVMSLSHPYHSFFTTLSDGKIINVDTAYMQEVLAQNQGLNYQERLDNYRKWVGLQVEDMAYLVDQLEDNQLESMINQPIDKDTIFLAGHSLGGAAALEIGRQEPQLFKGIVSLEAPFFGDIISADENQFNFIEEEYPLPVLQIYSDALWDKLPELGDSEYHTNVKLLDANQDKFINYHVTDVGHLGLTDLRVSSPFLTNLIDGNINSKDYEDVLDEINNQIFKFLEDKS